jgi:hypothetical protein
MHQSGECENQNMTSIIENYLQTAGTDMNVDDTM